MRTACDRILLCGGPNGGDRMVLSGLTCDRMVLSGLTCDRMVLSGLTCDRMLLSGDRMLLSGWKIQCKASAACLLT